MKLKIALAATAALLSFTAPASAAQITYTVSGAFDGTLNGGGFSNVDAVFTGIGDTDTAITTGDGSRNVLLSSLSAVANGTTYNFSGASLRFGTNNGYGGFIVDTDGNNPVVFYTSTLAGYDGVSEVATRAVDYVVSPGSFATDQGTVTIASAHNLTFGATIAAPTAAVPEPASWAMMIGGVGMTGGALRRRHKVKATVAFA